MNFLSPDLLEREAQRTLMELNAIALRAAGQIAFVPERRPTNTTVH